MYEAEKRSVKSLPKMARAATCPELEGSIDKHMQETQGHVTKLERASSNEEALRRSDETSPEGKGILKKLGTQGRGGSTLFAKSRDRVVSIVR